MVSGLAIYNIMLVCDVLLVVSFCFIFFWFVGGGVDVAITIIMVVLGGDLFDYIQQNGPLREPQALYIMNKLVSALQYLQQQGVAHLDISPENVLLDDDSSVYLADFGVATNKHKFVNLYQHQTFPGKVEYAAPEVQTQETFEPGPADVFSLGVMLAVILSGHRPYANRRDHRFQSVVNGSATTWSRYFEECKVAVSQPICQLLACMVNLVGDRVSLNEVAKMLTPHPVEPIACN
jgi:serine/threonine protein kinase